MKTKLLLLSAILFNVKIMHAQWCIPVVQPYGSTTPGISNVTFNTINHASSALESPTDNYINTNISTSSVRGQSYFFSMTFNLDVQFCASMNLRVWIDFNQNGVLDDAGETVLSINNQTGPTYTSSIVIPASAALGTTRMRVSTKMNTSTQCGHTLPDPCNIPADPIGWHGGVEDYNLNIINATGIQEVNTLNSINVFPNPSNGIFFFQSQKENIKEFVIRNILGEKMMQRTASYKATTYEVDLSNQAKGIYFITIITEEGSATRRLVVE